MGLTDYRDEMGLSSDEEMIASCLEEMDDFDLTQCAGLIHTFHRTLVPRIEELGLSDAQLPEDHKLFPVALPGHLNPF